METRENNEKSRENERDFRFAADARSCNALAIFARAPQPGRVKTRLARAIGEARACAFYEAMLRDTLRVARSAGGNGQRANGARVCLCYAPDAANSFSSYAARQGWREPRLAQRGDELGARMLNCFADLRHAGARRVVIIGSDAPDLPRALLLRAFKELQRCDLTFGRARDGGFYLIGASCDLPDSLFAGVEWSAPDTLARSLSRVKALSLRARLLPTWRDVDELRDVYALRRRLLQGHGVAPASLLWLRANDFA